MPHTEQVYFIWESDKERLRVYFGAAHTEWSGVYPLPVIEVMTCRLCIGALAAQEFLSAKASLQYIKKKDLPPLLSHVLTGLPPGKAAAPGKGFARNGMHGGGEVRRGGCRGFLYPHLWGGSTRTLAVHIHPHCFYCQGGTKRSFAPDGKRTGGFLMRSWWLLSATCNRINGPPFLQFVF